MAAKKRFYKSVLLADDGLSIQLDGRNLRSPAGNLLRLPTMALASAIADEWRAQIDDIDPATMPLVSLAVTVIARGSGNNASIQPCRHGDRSGDAAT